MTPVQTFNAPGLAQPEGFMHGSVATGKRMVFLAGQVGQDADGNVVAEGDLAGQTKQAMLNVAAALEAGGATLEDVAKLKVYVVDWDESKLEALVGGFGAAAEALGGAAVVPVTLIPVPRLFAREHLIEIEATAVIA